MLSSFHQKATSFEMFPFAVMTIRPLFLQWAIIYHVSRLVASETNDFLWTFLRVMLRWKAIIARVFVKTGIIVMTCFFASETFYILWKISEVNKELPINGFLAFIWYFQTIFLSLRRLIISCSKWLVLLLLKRQRLLLNLLHCLKFL